MASSSRKTIDFAEGLPLPLTFGSAPIALLAQRGRGKTRTAMRLAESFFGAGIPPVILDPVGVWWGLRLAADGRAHGLDIPILGGHHGDKPLLPTAGKVIAEALVSTQRACILDLTGFASQGEQRRFVTDFAETFYRGKMKNPSACHLFLEEAQEFAPQQPGPEEARMLGAFQRIFGQGRNFGIGATLISLFPQLINKRVLNLVEVLLILGLRGAHERKAIKLWMEDHEVADDERQKAFELLQHLGFNKITRKDGGALIWIPDMSVFGVHKIIAPTTFDSSKTPEPGEKPRQTSEPKSLDLEDLAKAMAATEEEAKANDPKLLRAEVARLRAELARKPGPAAPGPAAPAAAMPPEIKYVPADGFVDELRAAQMTAMRHAENAKKALVDAAAASAKIEDAVRRIDANIRELTFSRSRRSARPSPHAVARPAPRTVVSASDTPDGKLPPGMRKVLVAAAQHPGGVTREELSVLAGYKASARDTYVFRLRQAGYVETEEGRVSATDAGIAALGSDYEVLPRGSELLAWWKSRIPPGEQKILDELVDQWPRSVPVDELGEKAGYRPSARDTYIHRLSAKRLVSRSRGEARASDLLFDEANSGAGGRR